MSRLANYLNDGGCFYASFKYGDYRGERNGRYFTDFTEYSFESLLNDMQVFKISKQFITTDVRPNRESEKWLNVFLVS